MSEERSESYRYGSLTMNRVLDIVEYQAGTIKNDEMAEAFRETGHSQGFLRLMMFNFPDEALDHGYVQKALIDCVGKLREFFEFGEKHHTPAEDLKKFVIEGIQKDGTGFFETAKNLMHYNQYVFDNILVDKGFLGYDKSIFEKQEYYKTIKDMVKPPVLLPVDDVFLHPATAYPGKMLDLSVCPSKESQKEPTKEDFKVLVAGNADGKNLVLPKDHPLYKERLEDAKTDAAVNRYAAVLYPKIAEAGKDYGKISLQKIKSYASYCAGLIADAGFTRVNLDADSPFTPYLKRALEERAVYVLVGGERYTSHYKEIEMYDVATIIRFTREGKDDFAEKVMNYLMELNCRDKKERTTEALSEAYNKTKETLEEYGIAMPLSLQIKEADRSVSIAQKNMDITGLQKAVALRDRLRSKEKQMAKERGEVSKTANRSDEER